MARPKTTDHVLAHDEGLLEHHRAWMEFYYGPGELNLSKTGRAFGVTAAAVSYVRDSPAGVKFSYHIIGGLRSSLNVKAASLILQRLQYSGARVPIDLLVKIYSASLPKETPAQQMEQMQEEALRLASEYNLDPERSQRLFDFVQSGGKMRANTGESEAPTMNDYSVLHHGKG